MKCPSCANDNPDNALFCGYCKALFRPTAPSPPAPAVEPRRLPVRSAQRSNGERAPDEVKKSVAFSVCLWRDPGLLRIERRISAGGKIAGGVITFWSALVVLSGLGSFSIGRILGGGAFLALGVAIYRARLGVVLDGAMR